MKKDYDYIYLKDDCKAYFLKRIRNANLQNYYVMSAKNKFFRTFRKYAPKRKWLWGSWKNDVEKYKLFILGENNFNPRFTKYIKKHNPDAKIIMFIWNCIVPYNSDKPNYQNAFKDPNIDEIWSFDRNDVKKYNLKFNTQLYSKEFKIDTSYIDNDIVFCGREKGRDPKLSALKDKFDELGLKNNIIITRREKDWTPYDDYLNIVGHSKAVLNVVAGHQVGLSLREMESIFFEKKLITDNQDVVNYNFYDPQNIFIIGKDNFDDLVDFVNSPYKKLDKEIVEYYDFHTWIKRFNENTNKRN